MTIWSEEKVIWTNKQQKGWYFKFRCWLAFQRCYQIALIPYHIIVGYYYGYSTKEIYQFCKCICYVKNQR